MSEKFKWDKKPQANKNYCDTRHYLWSSLGFVTVSFIAERLTLGLLLPVLASVATGIRTPTSRKRADSSLSIDFNFIYLLIFSIKSAENWF